MPTHVARTRLVYAMALAAALAFAPVVAIADVSVWDVKQAADVVAQDPWTGVGDSAAFDADDAFVFADPQTGTGLDADATAVAVKIDQDRMAASAFDPGTPGVADGRVAAVFENFVSIGADGLAYASTEVARSNAAAAARVARLDDDGPELVALNRPTP